MSNSGHPKDSGKRRGLMMVLSSPSGAGKTTLSRMLLDEFDDVKLSISVTTCRYGCATGRRGRCAVRCRLAGR